MESMTGFKKYWIWTLIATLAISLYPIYMGLSVIFQMIAKGMVLEEHFPKYIIPYTPIAISIVVALLLMPILLKKISKLVTWIASGISLIVFFITELLFESKVIVTTTVQTTLESWQMFMCYVPPENYTTRTWNAIDILIGDYSPMFKMHFYCISIVLIITIINCLYGFGQMILTNNKMRWKALTIQSICTILFLGLCIFACFTAFFRDGELIVSSLSAILMSVFFILLGVTTGVYASSFLMGRKKYISVGIPAIVASATTLIMYIGELFLLSGHLYRFGTGFLFDGITGIVLAPIDILIILSAGVISAVIGILLNQKREK